MRSTKFTSPTRGKLSMLQVVDDISDFLHSDPLSQYRIVIGSDSQERRINGKKQANFITAVVVHRVGKGGRYYWKNGAREQTRSLRQKIYKETQLSLETAEIVVPHIRKSLGATQNWCLEIHIDVGDVGETRDMIKEVVGMVKGVGYRARTKPNSFAAACVADKHT